MNELLDLPSWAKEPAFCLACGVLSFRAAGMTPDGSLLCPICESVDLYAVDVADDVRVTNVEGRFSEGFGFIEEIHAVSRVAVDVWGPEPERWMVVEESGEALDKFAKYQRGRATKEEVAEEQADNILTSVHACATEDIPAGMLWKYLIQKLGRTKNRVAAARANKEGMP